ncbi:hypothetical protein [Rhodoferax saidenbachensis]|uniref:ATPase with chaperone activity n=1 Tax=Rhodoferax saidenbachensis TaxID=1484693 RepID=A0A1P8K605_9BURK|nr:hypothetical protein [Rhodoferax saidenbachensis]APW41419.1 hypothetical protein RS694_01865 [Rhodoferax saidenbachensis]
MADDYQIEIPTSFMDLYTDAARRKPTASREVVAARYELCEDMANLLAPTAQDMQFSLGITESAALERCLQGLEGESAVVSAAEARWVVCRLAELAGWPLPSFAANLPE